MIIDPHTTTQPIYTVSELNITARRLLEGHFAKIWLQGEVSNFACPSSGHWYFSLKDPTAQVRCAMFRGQNNFCKQRPKEGDHVLVQANVSLYEGRGDYQLIVEHLEYAGDGPLQLAFEALKKKLEQEGLFKPEHKKPLPTIPKTIGVITSPTGAAIRDVLSVLKRRMPSIPVIIYPCSVQGQAAAGEIVHALETANAREECDVLLLTRGGGSLEDLWPFNEEKVARAIFKSTLPIISGIGHEIDFTIADFVADQRAPTPSAAAECISPSSIEIHKQLQRYQAEIYQKLLLKLSAQDHIVMDLSHRLQKQHPQQKLMQQTLQLDQLEKSLCHHIQQIMMNWEAKLQRHAHVLDALSPLATLKRGYSIVRNEYGEVVHQKKQTSIGTRLNINIEDALIKCTVDQID